jgi:hypothetical protein
MTPTPLKRCFGRCQRKLPADAAHFHRHARSRDGLKSRCRECAAADRRDERLVKRLGVEDLATVAEAYRRGHRDGAEAAVAALRRQGRLLPSEDERAAQERARGIMAKVDESLGR